MAYVIESYTIKLVSPSGSLTSHKSSLLKARQERHQTATWRHLSRISIKKKPGKRISMLQLQKYQKSSISEPSEPVKKGLVKSIINQHLFHPFPHKFQRRTNQQVQPQVEQATLSRSQVSLGTSAFKGSEMLEVHHPTQWQLHCWWRKCCTHW